MKKYLNLITLILIAGLALVGCATKKEEAAMDHGTKMKTITVGATEVPHAEILEVVKPILAKEGFTLNIKPFSDYTIINPALDKGDISANFFQHKPFLDDFNKQNKTELVSVASVHIEPLAAYSQKAKTLNELKEGAVIAIPNDTTNGGRALNLLADAGLIKLKAGLGVAAIVKDIVENTKNFKIQELAAEQMPSKLKDVDLAVINGNYALQAKLVPAKDALFLEKAAGNPYANILVVNKGSEEHDAIKALAKALNSDEVKKFIIDKYNGSVIPAF
jgi:D-methionine transport system substrate-binding protein